MGLLRILFNKAGRRAGVAVLALACAAYGWMALRGPQGIQALIEKRREIRELQEHNASMARENERRRDRIKRLESSASEQEMEIRKQLKLLRPGETTFILPEGPKSSPPPEPAQ